MSVAVAPEGLAEHGPSPESAVPDRMPGGIVLSATLHVGLVVLIVLGLPTLFRPPPPEETPIAVELVNLAPQTRATHPNPHRPKPGAKPDIPVAASAPKPEPKPEPPQPTAAPPPSASAPPPPPPEPAKPAPEPPKPEVKAPPPPTPPPMPKPVEAQVPPPPRKPPEPKPKPEPKQSVQAFDALLKNLDAKKPDQKKPEDKKPEPEAFDSLLKNLTRQPTAPAEDQTPRRTRIASAAPSSQPKAPIGAQLTASELDLLIQQIAQCWNVPAGAREARDLVIEIKAVVNRDGTVQSAVVVDAGRYNSDAFFRAAADSAKRAVMNPHCWPLRVPPEKYDLWHNLDLFFNPKDLL